MNSIKKQLIRRKAIATTACMIIAAALLLDTEEREQKPRRRWWVKPSLQERGEICLAEELHSSDVLRIDEDTFKKLLEKVEARITRKSVFRQTISASDKLLITLRYLATGENYRTLMNYYRISESTISLFIPVVLEAIYDELKTEYLKVPSTTEWLEIANDFKTKWNAPNVIGAMAGKHIVINNPNDQAYLNYKNQHSIVLLAVVDANYNFSIINVGMKGSLSDGEEFKESDFFKAMDQNTLNFPEDKPLPGRSTSVPHFIVANATFPLAPHILKPYPLRHLTREATVLNYRLNRAHRIVEDTFEILANRFRVLINKIPLKPEKAILITQACCVLHNFLRRELPTRYLGVDLEKEIDDGYRFAYGLSNPNFGRPKTELVLAREEFKEYFNGCGWIPCQNEVI